MALVSAIQDSQDIRLHQHGREGLPCQPDTDAGDSMARNRYVCGGNDLVDQSDREDLYKEQGHKQERQGADQEIACPGVPSQYVCVVRIHSLHAAQTARRGEVRIDKERRISTLYSLSRWTAEAK